ncbi:MAG TPA: tetratricopeptide repeat protein [Trueperaceae bacterium]|nr:tetratricopeptide repeat protein [Trueperaceae bacterium]
MLEADRYSLAGRLAGQLGYHEDAVRLFTEGLVKHPDEPRLLRHRGHRHITLRRFEDARSDLQRAAEVTRGWSDEHEFYGSETRDDVYQLILGNTEALKYQRVPVNAQTISDTKHLYKATLLSSIYYHLALSHYLLGEFDKAVENYNETIRVATDDEIRLAASDWRYMSLRRLGRAEEAAATLDGLKTTGGAFEDSYYYKRWRMYRGELQPADLINPADPNKTAIATQGYGVGNWYLYNGKRDEAHTIFQLVLNHGSKDAFGYITSEVELQRS